MKLFQKIFKSNKGLSLLELVVAIAFLAIVITPVMNSFITAGRINAKSRKLMCANDCAQALMEGIADKSFYELCLAYDKYGSESVSASYAMSGLDNNTFNIPTCSTNTVLIPFCPCIDHFSVWTKFVGRNFRKICPVTVAFKFAFSFVFYTYCNDIIV